MLKAGLLLLALVISGCASRYQPHGLTGGYLEQQQDERIWKVTFERNDYTDRDTAVDFSLLRCAQLTLIQGYSYFGITAIKIGNQHGTITRSKTDDQIVVSNTNFTGKPALTNTIMLLRHKLSDNDAIYDAAELCRSLSQKHDLDADICQAKTDP